MRGRFVRRTIVFLSVASASAAAVGAFAADSLPGNPPQSGADRIYVSADGGASSCPADMVMVRGRTGVRLGGQVNWPMQTGPENPYHVVSIATFCVDQREVSAGLYAKCAACSHPSNAEPACGGPDNFPAHCVAQVDAQKYCTAVGRRLPTGDEWEFAARGADLRESPWGSGWDPHTSEALRPVGSVATDRSPFGVLDMGGNAAEWSDETYHQLGVLRGVPPNSSAPKTALLRQSGWPWTIAGLRCAQTPNIVVVTTSLERLE